MPDADAVMHMGASVPVDQRIIVDAAGWLVKIHAHDMTATDHAALARWRQISEEHERAWAAANDLARTFGTVPPGLGKTTLGRQRSRRTALKTLAILATAAPVSWFTWRSLTRERYQTASGEWQTHTLSDGSTVRLNSGSTVDIAFNDQRRLVRLQEGEVLIETVHDTAGKNRPFLVETKEGTVRALGTSFIVRQHVGSTQVSVLEHAVEILTGRNQRRLLEAGETTYFTRQSISTNNTIDVASTAWTQGILIADNQRLGDFIQELSRYRPGMLHCDPAVADLKISGVFQLADTDHALNILQETLPVALHTRTRYWITVAAAEKKTTMRSR
ncbi:FecR domain-containing protein [uncultured Oxalicibacterium sp.]|uniref:FecR domain-containing protein n=1 Tax=uncultured Oxalicibacterium sp. TaxID=1168540 RepID=UPI0025FCE9DD|nr:FecR domain-containing protein [uncultured Oxalicibacterium sp.]